MPQQTHSVQRGGGQAAAGAAAAAAADGNDGLAQVAHTCLDFSKRAYSRPAVFEGGFGSQCGRVVMYRGSNAADAAEETTDDGDVDDALADEGAAAPAPLANGSPVDDM